MAEDEVFDDMDLLDILLDPDNKEPITFYDDHGRKIEFEQVAVIPYEFENGENQLYVILKPLSDIPGIADDEAIVFKVVENDDGQSTVVIEEDEKTAVAVFDEYYKLLKDAQDNPDDD